jgi:ABC-2 type transport system permease protein
MNWRVFRALVAKDFVLFFRNRFFALISVLGLVFYVAIFYVMPSSVDEVLEIALYTPHSSLRLEQVGNAAGLASEVFSSEEALKAAISEGRYPAGIVLPDDLFDRIAVGQPGRVEVFFASSVSEELENAVTAIIREAAYLQSGQILPLEITREILGKDMVGMQIAPRDRLLPLIGVFIILTETLGLSSLISEEVEGRTVQALLITPLTVESFFLAKGFTGVSLAFGQVALFMVATGGLSQQPLLILVTLLLGSILVTGIGFLLASLGKDLMSVMAWGIPILIILSVPAFGVMFPGTISDWVKIIPSFYLVDTVHQAANLGSRWVDLGGNLLLLLAFDIVFIGLGVPALRRKLK